MNNTYATFLAMYDGPLLAGAQSAMGAGLQYIRNLLPYVFAPAVLVLGILGWRGAISMDRLVSFGIRVCVLIWLVAGAAYVDILWQFVVTDVPDAIATTINGGGRPINAIQQFDVVDAAAQNNHARILEQATGMFQIGNLLAAWIARFLQMLWLDLIFAVFVCMRWIGYILVAGGVFLLPFILFDSTRGWVMEFFGKLVGLCVWQLMVAILINVMLTGMQSFLRDAMGPAASLGEQITLAFRIGGWFFICFVLILLVPAVSAIGSHIGASSALVQSSIAGGGMAAARMAAGGSIAAGSSLGRQIRNMTRRTRQ